MTRADDELSLLLVDGDNLLHRLRGGRDGAGLAWLIPRLRASLRPGAKAVVVLDGHPDPGQPGRREVAPGVEIRHSMRLDADSSIVELLAARPFEDRGRTAVVTDDRSLTERARRAGGLTRRLDWLEARLEDPQAAPRSTDGGRRAVGLGHGRRPPSLPGSASVGEPADGSVPERPPWRAGRGATRKRGNPRRGRERAG